MYLSAERLALANQEIQETFEQTCVAWQAIPHWDTGDPGQTFVRNDFMSAAAAAPGSVEPPIGGETLAVTPQVVRFAMTLAQAVAPTPDALCAAVITRTAHLALVVDNDVVDKLVAKVPVAGFDKSKIAEEILAGLVDARMTVENAGYLAPSCLFSDKLAFKALSGLIDGVPATEYLSPVRTSIRCTASRSSTSRARRRKRGYSYSGDARGSRPAALRRRRRGGTRGPRRQCPTQSRGCRRRR